MIDVQEAIKQVNNDILRAKAGVNALTMYGRSEKELEKAVIELQTYELCLALLQGECAKKPPTEG
jgi:hypothetical protein